MSECRHTWTPDTDRDARHTCTACGESCPACNVCDGPTGSALLACDRCLRECSEVLDGITDALSHWQPTPPTYIRAVRYDSDRRGGNSDHVPIRTPDSPDEIEAVMLDWVAMWSELSGADNAEPVEYLRSRHMWAAHNAETSGWKVYRQEMRQLRHRARRVAGLLPQRQAGRCIYCGGDVVRDWADDRWQPRPDGLSDELRCADCRTQWEDRERWRFANRHTILALPEAHPDALVTRDQARMIFPEVPAATWRSWVRRDALRGEALLRYREMRESGRIGPPPEPERMPVKGWDLRGQPLYLLADLRAHVEARAADTRVSRAS